MRSSVWISEIQVAFMLLTRLPAGRLQDNVPSLAEARWAFPLVGAVVGGVVAFIYVLLSLMGIPSILAAILAFGAGLFITGAMHEDGLADSADGLGGGSDKFAKLEIMKDSRIGSYGVLALIFVMAARIGSLSEIEACWSLIWCFISLGMISRLVMVLYLDFLPAARSDGLGNEASDTDTKRLAASIVITMPALLYGFIFMPVLLVLVAIIAAGFAWVAKRQIGGQTGDICGAGQILSETVALIAMAALVSGH